MDGKSVIARISCHVPSFFSVQSDSVTSILCILLNRNVYSRVQLLGCTRLHSRSVCPEGRRPLWGGNSSPQEQQAFSPCSKLSFLTRHRRDNSRKVSRASRCDEVKYWLFGDMSHEDPWAKLSNCTALHCKDLFTADISTGIKAFITQRQHSTNFS